MTTPLFKFIPLSNKTFCNPTKWLSFRKVGEGGSNYVIHPDNFLIYKCSYNVVLEYEFCGFKVEEWWWWWIVFVVWLTDKRHLTLFPARTILRDPHHRESPTCQTGFEPAQNLSLGLVEWSCTVVITITPWRNMVGT